jgi:Ca2+:H+ antiporter
MLPAIKRSMAAIQGGPLPTNAHIMKELVLDPLNLLLVFAPFGVFGEFHDWPRGLTFLFCFLALVPLAKLLGDATEHLAENLNQTVGGLLNATFGNAVEMIITLNAIKANALDIVKSSLLGSILSNLLLVLGMAFFAGGLSKREQRFSGAAALINITMLLVGVMSFSLPTVFSLSNKEEMASLEVSRVSALFVSVGYIAYLVFQLHTHVEIFEDDSDAGQDDAEGAFTCVPLSPLPSPDLSPEACETELPRLESGASVAEALPATPGLGFGGVSMEAEDGVLSVSWALALLMASTVAVALLSEIMVDSIDGMVQSWRVPRSFVGVILLPIVGNACEHWSAVRMAYCSKMGTAIAIAVGSSTQIAMFVMPFAVLAGWTTGKPLDLNLGATGLAVMFLSVLVVFSIVMDGKSNWLEGFLLTLAYCLVAVLYWHTD